jgi:hypothetical protein
MDLVTREALREELAASFREAEDVTPADGQPAHILLPKLTLPKGWLPNPARALVRFSGWPETRPDFFIDRAVADVAGTPPRNSGGNPSTESLVLGETWRQFSFNFPWPQGDRNATRAVQLWVNRFRDPA